MLNPIVKKYKIILKTGLHIWWSEQGLKIWWIDSSVIKNPLTWCPYIPGSSIKWKMRSLIEMIDYSNKIDEKWNPVQDINTEVSKAFWMANKDNKISSRIIFEDFYLSEEWKEKFESMKSDFFEDKSENTVPRFLKWTANPRHIERVPAWVEFEWQIILLPHEWEYWISQQELEDILVKWIDYLQKTYIWWWWSRGNWRIEIVSN